MKRRFLAMLLALAMVFTMVPMAAAATEDSDEDSVELYEEGGSTSSGDGGNGGSSGSDDSQDGGDANTGSEDAKPTLDVGFCADGKKVKAAIEALDKSAEDAEALDETTYGPNTMWVRVTLPKITGQAADATTYRLEVVAPNDKTFTGKEAEQGNALRNATPTNKLTVKDSIPSDGETSPVVVAFSLLGPTGGDVDTSTYITDTTGDLSGKYILNLYENTGEDDSNGGQQSNQQLASLNEEGDENDSETTEKPVVTKEITLAKVTANFGADVTNIIDDGTAAAGTTALSEEPTQPTQYIYTTNDAKTTAYFFANTEDLKQGKDESYYEVLARLLTFKTGTGITSYEDTTSKEWRYDDATTTFTYTDIVTVAAATVSSGTNPVTVAEDKKTVEVVTGADKSKTATIEVQVTKNYIPQATGKAPSTSGDDQGAGSQSASTPAALADAAATGTSIDFTLTAEGSGTNANTWQAIVEEAVIPDDGTITVSAVPAVTVKVADNNNEVTLSDGVVTASTATPKIAMFKMTSTTTDGSTTYKATITVQCARQPIVTGSTSDTFKEDAGSNPKKWTLEKTFTKVEDAAITVGTVATVDAIADLTATAKRGTETESENKITLEVKDSSGKVPSKFKYKASATEPKKPTETKALTDADGYTDYSAAFDYNTSEKKDYVEVVTVNEINEITAWGLAVIPSADANVETKVEVKTEDGKTTVKTDADKKDVDTALEAAIQTESESGSTEPVTATLDFTKTSTGATASADVVEVGIPAESLDRVADHNAKAETEDDLTPVSVKVNTPAGEVTADKAVLKAIKDTTNPQPTEQGATDITTKVVLSITKADVKEGTAEEKVAESFDIEFKKITTYKVGESEKTTAAVSVEVETAVTVSVPTTLVPKAENNSILFAYLKEAGKLFYVGTATKGEDGRATFTAPHLSTYVLYAEEEESAGIGVNEVTTSGENTVKTAIIFDPVEGTTNEFEKILKQDSITLEIVSTAGLTRDPNVSGGSYTASTEDPTIGEFKLANGSDTATMTFTKGTAPNMITYKLTLTKEETPAENSVTIKIGSGDATPLTVGENTAMTATTSDKIVVKPDTATIKDDDKDVTPGSDGSFTLTAGTHNLVITVDSKEYKVTVTVTGDVTPTTPVEEGGKVTVDGVEGDAIEFKGTGSTKTATVKVVSGGSAISFKVGSGVKSVTLKDETGKTIETAIVGADGKVVFTTAVKPEYTAEFTDGTTTYVMNFELAGGSTGTSFTITDKNVGLKDLPYVFKEVTIANTKNGKVYLVEVIDDNYAGATQHNFLTMNGNGDKVRFYLLKTVKEIRVWEVEEKDVTNDSGNVVIPSNPEIYPF